MGLPLLGIWVERTLPDRHILRDAESVSRRGHSSRRGRPPPQDWTASLPSVGPGATPHIPHSLAFGTSASVQGSRPILPLSLCVTSYPL